MVNRKSYLTIILVLCATANLQAQQFISLWSEGKKPNFNGKVVTDTVYNERIWRVGNPGVYAFPVPKSENKGAAVLICPGGGYERLSYIYNGFQLAKWFNVHGINAFVLIYRLPHQQDLQVRELAPLQDAQRAMKIIRSRAAEWSINPAKIGVMGTSAGGHLASLLGTYNEDVSRIKDQLDTTSCAPDYMILLSPVISMGRYAHAGSKRNFLGADTTKAFIEKYSTDLLVTSKVPPTFMVHAQNDSTVKVNNSVLFYNALIENRVPASIHVFPQGGHGIALVDNPGSAALWLDLLELWMTEKGFIAPIPKK